MSEQTSGSLQEQAGTVDANPSVDTESRPDNTVVRAATVRLHAAMDGARLFQTVCVQWEDLNAVVAAAEQSILSPAVGQKPEAASTLEQACNLYCQWYDTGYPQMTPGAMAYELVSFCRTALDQLKKR